MYSEKVMELFMNPKNAGRMENPDGVGEVGNPRCGDIMKIYIRVKDDHIANISFETFGCASAIASSSMLTEMVKGLSLDEALTVSNREVAEKLGGLPPQKVHCSVLAEEGIRAAIEDYRAKQKEKEK
ncbi:MAG: Fe-S cluster assembly scaffold protein NifU [Synergistota bacterium]|nr:Fe-S cluster assembly scaffold protein NifU [Synergistota bacterium]